MFANLNGEFSVHAKIKFGALQGSALGLLLFSYMLHMAKLFRKMILVSTVEVQ